MRISELMATKQLTKYKLSKSSGIPYTTVNDICSERAHLEKCSAETIYRLAKTLDVSMETLLEPCFAKRISFDLFKSNVCHRLKALGDIDFIIDTLEKDDIQTYYKRQWYAESFYLLAMLDYISGANNVPLCNRYDELRKCKLIEPIFPSSVLAQTAVHNDSAYKARALKAAIPEFAKYNIIESEVRNVI